MPLNIFILEITLKRDYENNFKKRKKRLNL